MATVAELRGELQSLLKKAGKTVANADDALKWFNECLRRLQRYAHVEAVWTLTLVSGTEAYTLAVADYPILTLDKALYIPTGYTKGPELTLVPLSSRWVDNTVRFQPARAKETTHSLWMWPVDLAGALELYGNRRLDVLTGDNDVPALPDDFHDLLPLFAAMRFGGQDEDFGGAGRWGAFRAEYLERRAEFIRFCSNGAAGERITAPTVRW